MGCRLCFVVDRVEEIVGEGGSRSSWQDPEHDSSQLASKRNVAILEVGSPCSPRSALFARDLIRHSLHRVAPFCHEFFRLQRWSLCFHEKERVWEPSGTLSVCFNNGLSVLSCAISTLRLLLSSDERVWVLPVSTTGCPVLSCFTASSWKERVSISWERDVFLAPCAWLTPRQTTGVPFLSWSGFGFGWSNWEIWNCCTTCSSGRWATSEPNSFIQSCFKEILEEAEVTHILSRIWLLQFPS